MTTYYVDSELGNDNNPGTAAGAGNAWASIGKALDTAQSGDAVYIMDRRIEEYARELEALSKMTTRIPTVSNREDEGMKLYIYNENCTMAGRPVPDRIIEQYDGDPDEGGDWTVYEGTCKELAEIADLLVEQAKTAGAGTDIFIRRVADSIVEAVADDIMQGR